MNESDDDVEEEPHILGTRVMHKKQTIKIQKLTYFKSEKISIFLKIIEDM